MTKDRGLSLDLNKIAYLATLHDRMLRRLCGTYEIKNVFIMAKVQATKNLKAAIEMAAAKKRYLDQKRQDRLE